ncbi:hypothetical protein JT689_01620 (plasmid) [Halobacterium sp. GSL-19]|uniref:hypothetical protein n=1 Tax=Halobacterium sp. GSL-19 TaxID=2812551 RepID=UPI001962F9FE|nr:hypothetical protein [Halobacterium sp. GSL-19]QRY21732.1 hypothetical protein JT689_01620 [Halobacterium sp. GSL-19]
MPNRDRDDVADRLSRRFDNADDEESEQEAGDTEQPAREEHAVASQNETNEVSAESEVSAGNAMHVENVKSEWASKSFYLPEFLKQDLTRTYKQTDLEHEMELGEGLPKTRYYYPLVVALGIERIESMSPQEVKERSEALEERGEPE